MNGRTSYAIAALLVAAVVIGGLNLAETRKLSAGHEARVFETRKFASTLVAQKLYQEAAETIERHLSENLVRPAERESTLFFLGELYADSVGNPEKSMAAFLRLLHEYPASSYRKDAERRIVECKERLGRRLEAAAEMAALDGAATGSPATGEAALVVAKIGEEKITMADFSRELDVLYGGRARSLPESRDERLKLLREAVAQIVLRKVAKMKRLDSDPDVIRGVEAVRNQLLVQKLLGGEVVAKTGVDDMSVRLYYDAHRDEMRAPDVLKLSVIEAASGTEAAEIAASGDQRRFAALGPKELPAGGAGEVSAAAGADVGQLVPDIAAAANGEIIKKTLQTVRGTHIVVRRDHFVKGEHYPLERVAGEIREKLLAKKREEELNNYVLRKFAELGVSIVEDAVGGKQSASTAEVKVK